MDWFGYIDGYCERLQPGFWDEPLNALSNAAFLLAAGVAAVQVGRHETARDDRPLWILVLIVALVGIGSFLFHTFATYWAMLADIIPINIFILAYLGYGLRRYFGQGWVFTLSALAIFFAGSFALDSAVPSYVLNGSVGYLPALGALIAIAALLSRANHPAARGIAAAGVVFAVSLTFRTIDNAVCASWPAGTHFLWHSLNGLLLYVLLRTAVGHGRSGTPAPA